MRSPVLPTPGIARLRSWSPLPRAKGSRSGRAILRVTKRAATMAGRYSNARQFKRTGKQLK
jgi:hypothetical protein